VQLRSGFDHASKPRDTLEGAQRREGRQVVHVSSANMFRRERQKMSRVSLYIAQFWPIWRNNDFIM
jgi:hypothetical protein